MTDFAALRSLVSGPVLEPTDPGFTEEAGGFNLAIIHAPDAVVGVTSAADVAATVRFARDKGLTLEVLATGHGSVKPIEGGILITTRRLDTVAIDPEARIATIGAGTRWAAVVAAAADHGLAPITGAAPTVGAVGFLMGGGLGPLARAYGFSSDYARGFTVVTGDGAVIEASASENPELFWALRGGKDGLGVVTELRVALVELTELYAGSLMFAEENIEAVARGWVDWTTSAPNDVTTSIGILRFPDFEQVPPPLRGRTLLHLRFARPGATTEGERIAAPLRALAPVYLDQLGPLSPREVGTIHNDPTDPGPAWASGAALEQIDQDFVSRWLELVGAGAEAPLVLAELRHIGAATATDVPEGSAVGGRSAEYLLTLIGAPNPALFSEVVPGFADAVFAAVAPWLAAETTVNFIGAVRPGQKGVPWAPETLERLLAARSTWNPNGTFV